MTAFSFEPITHDGVECAVRDIEVCADGVTLVCLYVSADGNVGRSQHQTVSRKAVDGILADARKRRIFIDDQRRPY